MKYDIPAALQSLKPGAQWILRGNDYAGLEWLDSGQQPTEQEVKAKIIEADDIRDKVVSLGERTDAKIDIKNVTNSFTAVAVKDASSAELKIEKISTIGPKVMSYIKKPFYDGETKVKIEYKFNVNEILNFNEDFVAAKETTMFVNNKKIQGTFLDVEALYKKGPMKKN